VLLETHSGFAEKVGAEFDANCVRIARTRGLNVRKTGIDWDFSRLGPFDCITLCDVLEHVEDEPSAIQAVRAALRDDGILLITVPALQGLWSDHDVVNHHFRRYRRGELLQRFAADDWDVLKVSYFSTLLFPAIWSIRQCKTLGKRLREFLGGAAAQSEPPSHHLKFGNRWIDAALQRIFSLETPLLKHISFPIGSSLLLVLQKRSAGISGSIVPTATPISVARERGLRAA
jgi:SAM-dependent methyltransferase